MGEAVAREHVQVEGGVLGGDALELGPMQQQGAQGENDDDREMQERGGAYEGKGGKGGRGRMPKHQQHHSNNNNNMTTGIRKRACSSRNTHLEVHKAACEVQGTTGGGGW